MIVTKKSFEKKVKEKVNKVIKSELAETIDKELEAREKAFGKLMNKGFIGLKIPQNTEIEFIVAKKAANPNEEFLQIQYDGPRFSIVPIGVKTNTILTGRTTIKEMLKYYKTKKYRIYISLYVREVGGSGCPPCTMGS